jgi:hypothetical protein
MELDALSEVIDQLIEAGPDVLGTGEVLVELLRELSRLEAVVDLASGGFHSSGEWALDGARSGAMWLATKTRLPKAECARRIRLGRALGDLAVTEEAFLAGEIGSGHVSLLVGASRPATKDALARDEEMLVGQARELCFSDFARVIAYWDQLADPDGAEDADQDRRNRRDVYLAPSIHGMYLGKMTLDPISGEIVANELSRIERELFEADWQDAKTHLGREPKVTELSRTAAQRRADALVEMATRSAGAPGCAPAPLFSVLVGYETLHGRICELASGAVVSPGALLGWLDRAYIERAVFCPDNRVEVSKKARLFKGATRRAIQLRDRGCTHPYCDQPASRCQVDHVIPYAADGPTTQENGRLLCGFHNRARHQRPPQQRPPPRE